MSSMPSAGGDLTVGLTYDLRDDYLARGYSEEETAEFDQLGTIEALDETLSELGHRVERIGHADALIERLARGERWELVFNIAEGLAGTGREALVPALLEHRGIPYTFSDPLVMALTLDKGMTKRVFRDAGLPTAPFAVVETPEQAERIDLPLPLFVKPNAEGTGKGIDGSSVVRDRSLLGEQCRRLIERFRQPVLVESFLAGRELTVGIVGSGDAARAIGTLEVHLLAGAEAEVYSLVNKERCEELVEYRRVDADDDATVAEAERLALAAWRLIGCRDGGRVDLRCDDAGRPNLLEINPLAGLHPHHSDLPILAELAGVPYRELIAAIVESALLRARPALAAAG